MTTIEISGNIAEVKQRLDELALPADTCFQVTITEQADENTAARRRFDAEFANAPRRNGIIVLPYTNGENPLTVERIKELLYRGDMEDGLGKNWEAILEQTC